MKKRLMLPMMAFVFAIGLSFATERSTVDTQNDWVEMGPNRVMIEEVNCGVQTNVCTGQFEEDGLEYEIYDSEESITPKQGTMQKGEYLILASN